LRLVHPLRFYAHRQPRHGDRHVYAPLSRFLPGSIADCFEAGPFGGVAPDNPADGFASGVRVDVAARLRRMW